MSRYSPLDYLCYPSYNQSCLERRLEGLRSAGVAELSRLLGKGHSSVVLEAVLTSGERVAVKVLRTDSRRRDLVTECQLMRRAYPLSPLVVACGEDYIVMELVRGVGVGNALADSGRRWALLLKVLAAGRGLDVAGVDHRELSRAHKHVILTPDGRVKVIDYESASLAESPCNVCRLASWLAFRLGYLRVDPGVLIGVLRDYKRAREDARGEVFRRLIDCVVGSERACYACLERDQQYAPDSLEYLK